MILNRIKLLVDRNLRAKKLGVKFFRARDFSMPLSIKLNGIFVNLSLPNEHGVKISFIDIFLDDVYKLNLIKKISKKNNINIKSIIDIGGNCGLFSIFSRICFPSSVIHSYEPNPNLEQHLRHNSSLANFSYFIEAVGSNKSMVSLSILDKNESVHSNISHDKPGDISQIAFNTVYERIETDIIDIVKMDCEGSEWEILKKINIWKKVKFLTMEYHLEKNNFNHSDIIEALDRIGFKLLTKINYSKKINYGVVLAYNTMHIS